MTRPVVRTEETRRKYMRENANRYMVRLRGSQGMVEVWAFNVEDAEAEVMKKNPGVRIENSVLVPKVGESAMSAYEPIS
jgi:hypothetical protein